MSENNHYRFETLALHDGFGDPKYRPSPLLVRMVDAGWLGKKSGRGAGKHGGTGNAGLHKHKVMHMLKYMPDHFGRHGFKRPPEIVEMAGLGVCCAATAARSITARLGSLRLGSG